MSTPAYTPEKPSKKWFYHLDALQILGRLGLKTLGMKLFVAVLALTGLSIALACVVAYLNFVRTIESSDQLQRAAVSTADAVDLFLFENIKFAKEVASDDAVVETAMRSAREAERLGINRVPDAEQTRTLEERYRDTRVLKPDENANNFLREKRRIRGVIERMFFTDKYGLNVGKRKMCLFNASPTCSAKRAEFNPLCYLGPILTRPPA